MTSDNPFNPTTSPKGSDEMEQMLAGLGVQSGGVLGMADFQVDDDAFFRHFEACTLPLGFWRVHRSHIRMAYIYLTKFGEAEALPRLRNAIKAFFEANGIEVTPRTGYNETVTRAWYRIVAAVLKNYGKEQNGVAFCDRHPHLMHNTLLGLFYTPSRLYTMEAKDQFLEPDLHPLP